MSNMTIGEAERPQAPSTRAPAVSLLSLLHRGPAARLMFVQFTGDTAGNDCQD